MWPKKKWEGEIGRVAVLVSNGITVQSHNLYEISIGTLSQWSFCILLTNVSWVLSNSQSQVILAAADAAKSLQSYPTLCDPIDGSPSGSTVPGILQPRTLEQVAISFSNAWKWKVKVKSLSCVQLLATPWTAAYQAPLSMGFSRQEYWSGVPLPSPIFSIGICQLTKWNHLVANVYVSTELLVFKLCS